MPSSNRSHAGQDDTPFTAALLVDLAPSAAALVADALRTAGEVVQVDTCSSDALSFGPVEDAGVALCGVGPTRATRLDPLRRIASAHPSLPVILLVPPEEAALARTLVDEPRVDVLVTTPGYLDQLPLSVIRAARRAARQNRLARSADQILSDNRELVRLVSQLQDLAATDPLTELLNRRGVLARLESLVSGAQRHKHDLAVAVIDLDGLKRVNDCLGHQRGDAALRAAGDAIRSAIRASDAAGRIGGDEFVVLMPYTCAEHAQTVLRRIQANFDANCRRAGIDVDAPTNLHTGMSIGVAALDPDDAPSTRLLDRADAAMYRAKREGGRRIELDRPCPQPRLAA